MKLKLVIDIAIGGVTGQALIISLPGGIVHICKKDTDIDGGAFVDVGRTTRLADTHKIRWVQNWQRPAT
jgi:hypothetical protein